MIPCMISRLSLIVR